MKRLSIYRIIQRKEDFANKGGEAAKTLETCIRSRYRVSSGSPMQKQASVERPMTFI